jgi:hypothetical protein
VTSLKPGDFHDQMAHIEKKLGRLDLHARLDELGPLVYGDQSSVAVFFREIVIPLYDLRISALVFKDELKKTVENLAKNQQNKPRYVGTILSLTSKEPVR